LAQIGDQYFVAALLDELVADPALLSAWTTEFAGRDPITLAVLAGTVPPANAADAMRTVMETAGVPDEPAAASLMLLSAPLASPAGDELLGNALFLYSRAPGPGPLRRLARVDDRSLELVRFRLSQLIDPQEGRRRDADPDEPWARCWHPVDVTTGRHSYWGRAIPPAFHSYRFGGHVNIGSFCSISNDVRFHVSGQHRMDVMTTSVLTEIGLCGPPGHNPPLPPITIEHDVWIGHGATILAGVTIATGAVVGACAVVASDVRPYAIVVGNPAREIRRRFSDEECDLLLASHWWEMDDDQLRGVVGEIFSSDVREFVRAVDAVRRAAISVPEGPVPEQVP
jgi:acetyltransferase-like isoleucine patch superfamily enzyme